MPLTATLARGANFGPPLSRKEFSETLTKPSGVYTVAVWADTRARLGATFALDVAFRNISLPLPQRQGYVAAFTCLPLILKGP